MKKIIGIVIVAVLVAGGISLFAPGLLGRPSAGSPASATSPTGGLQLFAEQGSQAAENAKNEAVNKIIDITGAKQAVDTALRTYEGDIAAYIGVDPSYVDATIDSMAIDQWQVANLPEGSSPKTSIPFEYSGISASLTTYEDPGYVTLGVMGQSFTLAVPESAQEGMQLLDYVGYLG